MNEKEDLSKIEEARLCQHINKPDKYKCEYCGETFRLSHSLFNHINEKHKKC